MLSAVRSHRPVFAAGILFGGLCSRNIPTAWCGIHYSQAASSSAETCRGLQTASSARTAWPRAPEIPFWPPEMKATDGGSETSLWTEQMSGFTTCAVPGVICCG